MMGVSCVRKLTFCCGHRLMGHENKCKYIHGHNYTVYIHANSIVSNTLDDIGRVVDFSVLKKIIGGWIEDNWDHGFICSPQDDVIINKFREIENETGGEDTQKLFFDNRLGNPTAENMALYILKYLCPILLKDLPISVSKVVVWETENCFAEAYSDNNKIYLCDL